MASFRSEPGAPSDPALDSTAAFALRELAACWSQAYEAMTRADLQSVADLLDLAEGHLAAAGDGGSDTAEERELRREAASAMGRLRHAMTSGLDGLRRELGDTRRGARALRGYVRAHGTRSNVVARDA